LSQPAAPRSKLERHHIAMLLPYQNAQLGKAAFQVLSTFGLFFACTVAMYFTARFSVWLTLLLALPTSGLIVRIFILQHDCGHNALFGTPRLNAIAGFACSMVTLTPFAYWRRLHARHHGSWNDLDNRGIPADFFADCATVAEYAAMRRGQKFLYRLTHHPLLVHFVLPPIIFILIYRVPFDMPASFRMERISVYVLNLSLVALFIVLVLAFGWAHVLLVHLPALVLAAIIGIWLFAVQHRFEAAQWARKSDWTQTHAALHATSYLNLPRVLQWFSGNIGLHHVHHLRPRIPNYRLQECHDACPAVTHIATMLTLRDALRAPRFALWDENLRRMVPFPS
jgi:omega-6 fatty acid desaturase (delta-12 desaturase)